MSENPYAAPLTDIDGISGVVTAASGTSGLLCDGNQVIVTSGTVLPPRCVVTNQPVTKDDYLDGDLTYAPQIWLLVAFLFGGPLIMLGVYMFTRKKCRLIYALHSEVQQKLRKRKIIGGLLLLTAIGAFFAAYQLHPGLAALGLILLLVSLVFFFRSQHPLTAAKHQKGRFWIKGCSAAYLREL